jgi:integrase
LSASTLQNNLSIFRTFAEWIGKAGMVRDIEHYLGSGIAVRSSIASQDRSWSARGIDLVAQVVRSCGITRRDGITSHGLRHEYANTRYQELTGADSPVRGGGGVERGIDQAARHVVAEELGHSRESVTTHYLGR